MGKRNTTRTQKTLLKPFSFSAVAEVTEGRQDKIELICRDFLCFQGTDDDIKKFRRTLAQADASKLRIFNRAPSDQRHPVVIRKQRIGPKGGGLGSPLFGGKCYIRKTSAGVPGQKTAHLELRLELNPTRFLVHQWTCEGAPRKLGNLTKHDLPYGVGGEYSLELASDNRGPSDNWLPDKPTFQANASGRGWQKALRSYLRGTLAALEADFRSVMRRCDLQAVEVPPRSYRLKAVETYWEFASPDPIKLVYDLRPLVAAFCEREIALRHYDRIRRRDELAKHHNAPVLSVMIGNGILVVIYAKTNKRVRFEVRHTLGKLGPPLGGKQNTVAGESELETVLSRFRDDAASVIESLLAHMKGRKSFQGSKVTPFHFLADFADALAPLKKSDRSGARGVLSMLVHSRSVDKDGSIGAVVNALREAAIIECVRRNNNRAHKLASKYLEAADLLRKADSGMLGIRDRNRPIAKPKRSTRTNKKYEEKPAKKTQAT